MKYGTTLLTRFVVFALALVFFGAASSLMYGQATYTWTGSVDVSWQVAGNWTPTRSSPNIADTLIFDGTQTNQPSDSISVSVSRLLFTGNTTITMTNLAN